MFLCGSIIALLYWQLLSLHGITQLFVHQYNLLYGMSPSYPLGKHERAIVKLYSHGYQCYYFLFYIAEHVAIFTWSERSIPGTVHEAT
jgi:hypothetical protein